MIKRPSSIMSVVGPVKCRHWTKFFDAVCEEGDVHRVDADLELCVCKRCGQGWIRDVDAFTRLEDAMERLNRSTQKLANSINSMKVSFQSLSDAFNK